jgi:hypothetical protein
MRASEETQKSGSMICTPVPTTQRQSSPGGGRPAAHGSPDALHTSQWVMECLRQSYFAPPGPRKQYFVSDLVQWRGICTEVDPYAPHPTYSLMIVKWIEITSSGLLHGQSCSPSQYTSFVPGCANLQVCRGDGCTDLQSSKCTKEKVIY